MRRNISISQTKWDLFKEYCDKRNVTLQQGFNDMVEICLDGTDKEAQENVIATRIAVTDEQWKRLHKVARGKRMSTSRLIEFYIDIYISKQVCKMRLNLLHSDNQ